MPAGREEIPWSALALVLVIGRLLDPSSELRLAEHLYERTALGDLLGVPTSKVNDDRLYRGLDKLLPHKDALQAHLKNRLGELFDLKAYMQLTQAENAFRIHKSDLSLRPVWHQKQERVEAHVLVCFLAYVLWKTLAQWCKNAGLGDEPRKVLDEIAQIAVVDVVLPTKAGPDLLKRCIAQASEHQNVLLHRLKLQLPSHLETLSV
jgi:hypothetical protein